PLDRSSPWLLISAQSPTATLRECAQCTGGSLLTLSKRGCFLLVSIMSQESTRIDCRLGRFDVDGRYGRRARLPNDAESVLKNRAGVCEGYANLMLELCSILGVTCKVISGYSKENDSGVTGDQQAAFDPTEFHAWNAVRLDGRWKLIDCTWGAGFVKDKNNFVRQENDLYFLPNPKVFIEDHFPFMNSDMAGSKKWQLLKKPIDLATFHSRVRRQKAGIEHQVQLVSHKQALIDVDSEVTLKFKGTGRPLTAFSAKFVNPGTGESISSGQYIATVLNHRKNEVTVTARPPTCGAYWELRVQGTTEDNPTHLIGFVSYKLRSTRAVDLRPFPQFFDGFYGLLRCPQRCGFSSELRGRQAFRLRASSGELQLKLPVQQPVSASALLHFAEDSEPQKQAVLLEMDKKALKVSVRMYRRGFHRLTLFCKD
uniref:TGc domain-containing protein n=1 Tax=Macrostomum lignano TaxID=282301 RepID=A0A1I8GAX0_9PLAT